MALRNKDKWIGEGKIEAAQEILINLASEQYGVLPFILETKIKSIQSDATLRNLTRKVVKLHNISCFNKLRNQVTDN